MKVLLIGGGAREHAILKAIARSSEYRKEETYAVMKNLNPGIASLCNGYKLINETNINGVLTYAKELGAEMVFIGPEAPLEAGISDAFMAEGMGVVAPTQSAARIETSKSFLRNLMKKHEIKGCPKFRVFNTTEDLKEFIYDLEGNVAVKPIGLTGGKGVKVMGDHFKTPEEAYEYAKEVIEKCIGGINGVVIEEKLDGEEFTLQAFSDGSTLKFMPCVQDHKRAFEGDKGPNTGGMGSYSQRDGLLPFMTSKDLEEAKEIMGAILKAMEKEGAPYKGIMYGQFMLTADGPKVIEINARFGDPEAMNVLPLLKTDMLEIGDAIINGKLSSIDVEFNSLATVCKYVVPKGYGIKSITDCPIDVDEDGIRATGAELFYASVNARNGRVYTTTSRSLAVVGFGNTIEEAEGMAEDALKFIKGENIYIRHDIGKRESIEEKIRHMEKIRKKKQHLNK